MNDFWRMIWEKDCTCVIALTNIVELGKVKCFQYWADDETSFGEIHVKTVKTQLFADFTLRFLDIKKVSHFKLQTTQCITLKYFKVYASFDHGVPTTFFVLAKITLIYFVRTVKAKRSYSIILHPGLIMVYLNIPQNYWHSVIVLELCIQ